MHVEVRGVAGRLRALLEQPHLARYAAVLALLLTLPSLSNQLVFDDYVLGLHARASEDIAGLAAGPSGDLFSFTSGRPDKNRALMEQGVLLPWWSDPHHLNAFLRPLSSLTHRLDFAWFPDQPALMHLHSWLWFCVLLLVAFRFYRNLSPTAPLAGLAFALFALDDPHGATLSWLSNRNAIVALCLAIPAVIAHRHAVRDPRPWRLAVGPLWFALGLFAGEAALGALGYLAAHVLVLERDALSRRAARLLPYAVPLALWRVAYGYHGLGSFASGAYHDPIREPVAFALSIGNNLPILLGAQLSVPYADLAFWGPPEGLPVLLGLSLFVLGGTLWLARRMLVTDRVARFYGVGALLAAVPVSASLPGQRLLLGVSFGAAGFVAHLLSHLLQTACNPGHRQAPQARQGSSGRFARVALVCGFILHLPAAAAALPFTSRSMTWVGALSDHIEGELPQCKAIESRTLVIVNAPFNVMASYVQLRRAYEGVPRPAHLYWLFTASSPVTVTRAGQNALLVEPEQGFLWSAQERHYRADTRSLRPGTAVSLPGMTAQVISARPDGRPAKVRFEFGAALEDSSLSFFVFDQGRYVPWEIPGAGQRTRFKQEDFFTSLAQQVVSGD